MRKRFLGMLLCACMVIVMFPVTAFASGYSFYVSVPGGKIEYRGGFGTNLETGDEYFGWEVRGYEGDITDVTILGELDKDLLSSKFSDAASMAGPVTSISYQAFKDCKSLKSLTVSDKVGAGYEAFKGCSDLKSITFEGESRGKYDTFAREGCSNVTSISFLGGITEFYESDFRDYTNITSLTIPASVKKILYSDPPILTSLKDIYYGGTKEQWNSILWTVKSGEHHMDTDTAGFSSVNVHYNSSGTGAGTGGNTGSSQKNMAYASTQTVTVDGKPVEFQMYALKDAKGYPTNYIKLRDLAYKLNGTKAQFEVKWDGSVKSVNIVKGEAYTSNGSEMSTPFSGDREYSADTSATKINGTDTKLSAIRLTDDKGGGYTYYKLRDLGSNIGFNVDWSSEKGVYVETDKPYQG